MADFKGQDESLPFNLGLDTLKRIADIIDNIGQVSVRIISPLETDGNTIDRGSLLRLKFGLVKQLFVQSYPLLNEVERNAIQKELDKVKFKQPKLIRDEGGRVEQLHHEFSVKLDVELDEIEKKIQNYLAIKGCFMPKIQDVRFAWKQQ